MVMGVEEEKITYLRTDGSSVIKRQGPTTTTRTNDKDQKSQQKAMKRGSVESSMENCFFAASTYILLGRHIERRDGVLGFEENNHLQNLSPCAFES